VSVSFRGFAAAVAVFLDAGAADVAGAAFGAGFAAGFFFASPSLAAFAGFFASPAVFAVFAFVITSFLASVQREYSRKHRRAIMAVITGGSSPKLPQPSKGNRGTLSECPNA
jgi:preprotein translocase subunit SecG